MGAKAEGVEGKVGGAEEVEYGPDGQQLTEEERAFLSEAFGNVTEALLRPSTDDDEESAAFEEFLTSQGKAS